MIKMKNNLTKHHQPLFAKYQYYIAGIIQTSMDSY